MLSLVEHFRLGKLVSRMVKRTGGPRKKTRHKLQKKPRTRGKIKIRKILDTFKAGERVRILQEPGAQRGMPHPRFKNLIGVVIKKQGDAYIISIKDGNKEKKVIS